MARVRATPQGGDRFHVVVEDAHGSTRHEVRLDEDLRKRWAGTDGARIVEASFRFLLDREPKESILARFDLSVIARYFPEYERELPGYFDA